MDENTPTFSPEARAELLAMYTGMAMQAFVQRSHHALRSFALLASDAVKQANATVDALEAYHVKKALEEKVAFANERAKCDLDMVVNIATPGASDVSSSQ